MTSVSPDSFSTVEQSLRAAPWSPEAEQAVLGAMLLDQDAALRAAELLDYAMFYREAHRRLFRAMVALTDRKSTRLNSSHQIISYAVFCLKKKNMRSEHHPSTASKSIL